MLIGVNDLVRGLAPVHYRESLATIYTELRGVPHVAAVSIPTWSNTPAAADFGGPEYVDRMTRTFNDLARGEALARGFAWVDISSASTSAIGSQGWIAEDGLHPGDAQYAAWAEAIWSAIGDGWTRRRSS